MTIKLMHGDCRDVLRELPDGSAHCCVTSPPYFGLRDYQVDGQIGLETTPAEFVAQMVAVFREVRRVLHPLGTLWLNLGDSYAGSGRGGNPTRETSTLQGSNSSQEHSIIKRSRSSHEIGATARDAAVTGHANRMRGSRRPAGLHEQQRQNGAIGRAWLPAPDGLKQKDLIGAPWLVAFALRADGWWLRQDIIWAKPNPMPESVTDRCTKAHEYLFLLSKCERYYFDQNAIAEPRVGGGDAGVSGWATGDTPHDAISHNRHKGDAKTFRGGQYVNGNKFENSHATSRNSEGNALSASMTRNRRSVWSIASEPFSEAHFATFPPALIEPCILAGCPAGGTVLDPFGGAGTTGLVADRLGRNAVLIELNAGYIDIAKRRLHKDAGMFAEIAWAARRYKQIATTTGGCEKCRATWHEPNAHMLAAKHAQDTGHRTWSQTAGRDRHHYGAAAEQPRMI